MDGLEPLDQRAFKDALSVARQGTTLDWPFPDRLLEALGGVADRAATGGEPLAAAIAHAREIFAESA